MAEDKHSFILYSDLIHVVKKLVEEDRKNKTNNAGELFLHILEYVNDLDPIPINFIVDMASEPIKRQLKRDLKKYIIKKESLSMLGREGNLKRWNLDLYKQYKLNEISLDEAEKKALERKLSPPDRHPIATRPDPIANVAVNVNDTVNVNVNDTVNVNVNDTVNVNVNVNDKINNCILLSDIKNVDELKENEFDFIAYSFWQLFKVNLFDAGITKTTNLDKAKLSKWSNDVRLMMESDGRTKEELVHIFKFLKKDEFWKPNIQSIAKLREKFEQLFSASKKVNPVDKRQANLNEVNESLRRDFEKLRNS